MGRDSLSVYLLAIVLFVSGGFLILSVLGGMDQVKELQSQLSTERGSLAYQTERVAELEAMVAEDDRLLYHFTHETWDRKCTYDIQAGITLADGSVKSSVVQFCD